MSDPDELPESSHVDPWAAHLPGQELVPAYLVSRFAAQYRAVVDVLLEAQDDSLTGVAYDEILGRLREHLVDRVPEDRVDALLGSEGFGLDARLDQLVGWSVLTRWQEPARTGEDFLRRRDRYQLTPAAAAVPRLLDLTGRRRRRGRGRPRRWPRGRSTTVSSCSRTPCAAAGTRPRPPSTSR